MIVFRCIITYYHYIYKTKRGIPDYELRTLERSSPSWTYDCYYRRAKGMTQAELAEAVHISRTHMSNIEAPNTKTSISLNLLFDIAEALDIPVKELFDFQGRSL